ncbi:MAG: DUF1998 domain-containing protein, partial [Leptospiraceae bacterium]|nr:DUF1998 domain-containing protein [Leptospiraceae bacterium]
MERPVEIQSFLDRLHRKKHWEFLPSPYEDYDRAYWLISSFLSLVHRARVQTSPGGPPLPLLPVQTQLWIREIRRVGREVKQKPAFVWLDELDASSRALPAFHCRDCGQSGWIALRDPEKDSLVQSKHGKGMALIADPSTIYTAWFDSAPLHDENIVIISPVDESSAPSHAPVWSLNPDRLILVEGKSAKRSGSLAHVPVIISDSEYSGHFVDSEGSEGEGHTRKGAQQCPHCQSRHGVLFVGSQAATLSSVALDELFGSRLNESPKLLAFTDSVQDASHRAGFFGARTYSFTFRTLLQGLIEQSGPAGLPVEQAPDRLIEFLQEERSLSIKDALATLLPPDLEELDPWLEFLKQGKDSPDAAFLDAFKERVLWNVLAEFGLNLFHGRSLETSAASAWHWDPALMDSVCESVHSRLESISPALKDRSPQQLLLWIHGIWSRIRAGGALAHNYLKPLAKNDYWSKRPFGHVVPGREMYPPGGKFRPSLILQRSQGKKDSEHFLIAPGKVNPGQLPWIHAWTRRCLQLSTSDFGAADVTDLLELLLQQAEQCQAIVPMPRSQGHAYSLSIAGATLKPNPDVMECSQTGRLLVRAGEEAALWKDSFSMEYRATSEARYLARPVEDPFTVRQKYYRDRYRRGAPRRIVAEDHTGLLDPDRREEIEQGFKQSDSPLNPNVLVATSTLEMGIDIGDLSSTMLCSVPPATANYLQRIGRAGRSSGTALILTFINQRPHDLFFFGRPADMLKGKVQPPGCWLQAPAVLARQYLGFCMDRAVAAGVITEKFQNADWLVKDFSAENGQIKTFLRWIADNQSILQKDFLQMFPLSKASETKFLAETKATELTRKITEAIEETKADWEVVDRAIRGISGRLKSETADEERKKLLRELDVLKKRKTMRFSVYSLGVLTEAGLLPNYAFPERGIRFEGIVAGEDTEKQSPKPIRAVRPARTGISDLAPWNTYYIQKKQFQIQRIGATEATGLAEKWSFCGNCGFMLQPRGDEITIKHCPRCNLSSDQGGSITDQGQNNLMVDFSRAGAISHEEYFQSISGDSREERIRLGYTRINLFSDDLHSEDAILNESLPFGMEFLPSVTLREINAGYRGASLTNEKIKLHRKHVVTHGFRVCKYCGAVQAPGTRAILHAETCPAFQNKDGDYPYKDMFLYRQLQSEAIRILLAQTDESEVKTLEACIRLGLRLHFGGRPAHIDIQTQEIPQPDGMFSSYYLVLMDAVPGGTGFLSDLYGRQTENGTNPGASARTPGDGIIEILKQARQALKDCVCRRIMDGVKDPDGCYRCIRSYELQYHDKKITREKGIQLLDNLLQAASNLKPVNNLRELKADPRHASALEKNFEAKLLDFVVNKRRGEVNTTIVAGKEAKRFQLPNKDEVWTITPQPDLGLAQGISAGVKPDFLITCSSDKAKPLAIFVDGFQYHAHPNNRLRDDAEKRRAILESGGYRVFSITHEDLKDSDDETGKLALDNYDILKHLRTGLDGRLQKLGYSLKVEDACSSGFKQLLAYIQQG